MRFQTSLTGKCHIGTHCLWFFSWHLLQRSTLNISLMHVLTILSHFFLQKKISECKYYYINARTKCLDLSRELNPHLQLNERGRNSRLQNEIRYPVTSNGSWCFIYILDNLWKRLLTQVDVKRLYMQRQTNSRPTNVTHIYLRSNFICGGI